MEYKFFNLEYVPYLSFYVYHLQIFIKDESIPARNQFLDGINSSQGINA